MAFLWTSDLSVGFDEIDNQHKELFQRINSLLDAMSKGKGKEEVEKVITFLEEYVVSHFGAEEAYMVKFAYPDYSMHKRQHEIFGGSFQEIKREYLSQGANLSLTLKIQTKICDWLLNHIRKVDVALGTFLKSQKY